MTAASTRLAATLYHELAAAPRPDVIRLADPRHAGALRTGGERC
jgi:hypothetical protein